MKYFIYILYSEKSQIYYVGYTTDVVQRLLRHNEISKNSFTSKHRPWILKVYFGVVGDEADAMRIEKFIKKQKSRKFIERLIDEEVVFSEELAKLVRVPKLRD
ncbi:MAG: GIY-YIG nuclease family protein [Flavobacteriales bacterium]|jgi:Predicted endonuclease containing a URI domain|nr:GIY-YIG nuclease family protein [Flavobacteriales bacterium]MCA0391035.1 GIY-YIG nuclease family protein [Bacteroidota bacterium]